MITNRQSIKKHIVIDILGRNEAKQLDQVTEESADINTRRAEEETKIRKTEN